MPDLRSQTCASALFALLLLVAPLADAQHSSDARPLIVTGSTTIYPLMTDIVQRFEALNPGVQIAMRSGGSGQGLADLRGGVSDIAMVSRQLGENERDLFSFPLCRDGAAVVVHRSNPLKGLTRQQLSDLLTGAVADWHDLGVRSGAIDLAWRRADQGIPELLLNYLKLKPEQIQAHSIFLKNEDAVRFVASDRNAVSAIALGFAERSVKSGMAIKLLAYEGTPASTAAVRDRTYLLARPLTLVTRTEPTGLQKQLIDYAASRAVTDLHAKYGFVPYEE
jgi:phosphate transport system substrate-binding protein